MIKLNSTQGDKLVSYNFLDSGNVPQHTNQSTTRQLLHTQQMDPGYLPNTTEYLPQQGHYHDGNYPPPRQLQPEGSFCPVNILPSQHTGLAGQVQVEGHSCQGNCDTITCMGKLIKYIHYNKL